METFELLKERGYIHQLTHSKEIIKLLNEEPITFYLGIDPTADSLHVGHFFALTMFRRMQEKGHKGILVIGGATALIGDPTGKSDMRTILTKEEVNKNKQEVRELVKRFVITEGENKAIILDNSEWMNDKTYIDFMRDVGMHFNVNTMLNTTAYSKRMENGGLTFLEMGYMLIQAFDFVHLNKTFGCTLQIGGSDQWANIVAGVDLARKMTIGNRTQLFGLTCPLLLKADGEKMGKTASGTLWVSREKTTVFDFYQAWINSFDEDVERSLAFFSDLEMNEIKRLCETDIRHAKKLMAFEVTKLVHGEKAAKEALKASEEIFERGNITEHVNSYDLDINLLENGINICDLLTFTSLTASKSEARRLIKQKGIKLNESVVIDSDVLLTQTDFTDGTLLLQRGKKSFVKVKIVK